MINKFTTCSCALPACLETGCVRMKSNPFQGFYPPTPYEELMNFILPDIKDFKSKSFLKISDQEIDEIKKHINDPVIKWNSLTLQEDCKKLLQEIERLKFENQSS